MGILIFKLFFILCLILHSNLYELPGAATSKYLQTRWLKIMTIYCLLVLKVTGLKSRCQQGYAPSETCNGILPWLFVACGGLLESFSCFCFMAASLPSLPSWSHDILPICLTQPSSYKDTSPIGLGNLLEWTRPTLHHYDFILMDFISK